MSTVMLLNHSETDRKKGAVRGRESRNQSLNTKLTPTEFAEVEVAAAAHGCALGEWVRDVILRELREVGQRSIAGRDPWGSIAPSKRVATSGRRPETRTGGVRQIARRNQRCQTQTRQQVG